jgi:porphobilinogen synthase
MTSFPVTRMRRLRRTPALRALVRETSLAASDFIYPLFVTAAKNTRKDIASMPGVAQLSVDSVLQKEIEDVVALGIRAVLLFGIPASKDAQATQSYAAGAPVQRAVGLIKQAAPDLVVMTDVCLCEYTDHGHCGLIQDGAVDNDSTLGVLGKVVTSHAAAGADVVAPSGMMDGMVGAIRGALDGAGFADTAILSYAVKYASSFYGPFRDAAESPPSFGDRKSHQMDYGNVREALRECALDVAEGADALMVKPGLPYLDVLRAVRDAFDLPLASYNVSGEYAMVKAAARNGWIDERGAVLELLRAFRRAGADLILTYHAKDAARWLRETPADA